MATGDLHTNLAKIGPAVPEILADRQTDTHTDAHTDRHTDGLITILCTPTGTE